MTLKRDRSYMVSDHERSNCLELLDAAATGRIFTCKTCQRKFSSFQALGGHRASHQKLPKLLPTSSSTATSSTTTSDDGPASPPKPKTHECTICGLEFPIGQALGGHMRRHRQQLADAAAREQRGRELSAEVLDFSILYDEVSARPKLKNPICSNLEGSNLDLDLTLKPPFLQ